MADSRLLGIDTARGTAMLLVCFSHFLLAVNEASAGAFQPGLMVTVTGVASPTFMAISGLTFGYLIAKSRPDPRRMRRWLVDRAVLLLLPVHLTLRLPHLASSGHLLNAFTVIEITDAIALAMLLNVWLVKLQSHVERLAVALAMFAVSWWLNLTWSPETVLLTGLKDVLVRAAWDTDSVMHGFAVLPWAAVHLSATVLGERMADIRRPVSWSPIVRIATKLGVVGVTGGLLAKLGELWWRETLDIDRSSPIAEVVSTLTSPFGKYPPSPSYLAFCGGAGLILLAGVLAADQRGWFAATARRVAILGRASLCIWVLQAWLYWGAVRHLPVPRLPLLPLYFVVTLGAMWMVAYTWDRHGWNRCLTLRIHGLQVGKAKTASAEATVVS